MNRTVGATAPSPGTALVRLPASPHRLQPRTSASIALRLSRSLEAAAVLDSVIPFRLRRRPRLSP